MNSEVESEGSLEKSSGPLSMVSAAVGLPYLEMEIIMACAQLRLGVGGWRRLPSVAMPCLDTFQCPCLIKLFKEDVTRFTEGIGPA